VWWWKKKPHSPAGSAVERIRQKYVSFRELLSLNNECLELMAGLQEDLQYIPARRDVVDTRVTAIFEKADGVVGALEKLTGMRYATLLEAVDGQRNEVGRYIAAHQELVTPRLSARLSEINADAGAEAGGKAAILGEVKNRVGLPTPDGYVLTTEAYRQFCGIPLWTAIRDALRNVDLNDLAGLQVIAARLQAMVMERPVPRAIEVAITERAQVLDPQGRGLAVRSSAPGEGGEKGETTYAGQFLSLINVPLEQVVDAYKRVVAARFSERALFYRLSTGLLEVESPMAVLFLPVIRARASGIMYTRDPADSRSKGLWVTATRGLGLEIASGRMPADLFVVSRSRPHAVLEQTLVRKEAQLVVQPGGGLMRDPLEASAAEAPSLQTRELETLAEWGVRLEEHFHVPQDVEWALDEDGKLWILQARSLALVHQAPSRSKARVRVEAVLSGGRTVYPGRVSGPAFLIEDPKRIDQTPAGAIIFLHRPSPEIVQVFPRIGGLVAEWGNVAGHAAALLREFKVPSVFMMTGASERLKAGDPVSLDAVQAKVYPGALFEARTVETSLAERYQQKETDPISRRLLNLHLLDPSASNFRPAGCKSAHDVLRFCHEKGVEAMFAVNDFAVEDDAQSARRLKSALPLNFWILDLGGGLAPDLGDASEVAPEQIASRPFRALWRGISHPAVTWTREMPASLTDLASVMAGSFYSQASSMRALGERSYLLVAEEYMNLNARLAYHFSMVDACLSDNPGNNYISFRFAGGGATRQRRHLRACLVEACLSHYGFRVDRRGDLVNAWFKKAPAAETETNLDILGRLMASTAQLDMYMTSHDVMQWHLRQFLEGNYSFRVPENAPPKN